MVSQKQSLALVFGNLPTVEEIDQFRLLAERYDVKVISSESICGFLTQNSHFQDLTCMAIPDYDENPTYLPGLEQVLADFDVVVVKERLGLYAYQIIKAKWKNRFRLAVWVDNLAPYPGDDLDQMRTVRREITNGADVFIVQTKAARTALELEGVERERIVEMVPWVENRIKRTKKTRAQALSKLGMAEGEVVIAHFGNLEWEDGLLELAAGVKIAITKDQSLARRLKLVFCGIGSFAPQLRDMLVHLGIDDRAVYMAPNRSNIETLLTASDAIYFAKNPARDRIDGDPYLILTAMANGIPILAHRTPVIEELCGKHRLDFCAGSADSLAQALGKVVEASSLTNNVIQKNKATIDQRFNQAAAEQSMVEIFEALLAKAPVAPDASSVDHQVREVEARVQNKQYLAAIDIIESIFKYPDLPVHHKANLYRLIGDCFAKLGDRDGAKDAYIQAAELDPYSAKAYIGLGTIGLVKASHDIAVLHFQKAVSLAPQDEMANLGLGLAFQGMEEFQEASRWVVKALEINPDNTAAIFTLVKIAYEVSEFSEAEKAVRLYITRHPNDYNMIYTLGGICFKQEGFEEVVALMNDIIKIDPMDSRAHALAKQARRAMEEGKASSLNG